MLGLGDPCPLAWQTPSISVPAQDICKIVSGGEAKGSEVPARGLVWTSRFVLRSPRHPFSEAKRVLFFKLVSPFLSLPFSSPHLLPLTYLEVVQPGQRAPSVCDQALGGPDLCP